MRLYHPIFKVAKKNKIKNADSYPCEVKTLSGNDTDIPYIQW